MPKVNSLTQDWLELAAEHFTSCPRSRLPKGQYSSTDPKCTCKLSDARIEFSKIEEALFDLMRRVQEAENNSDVSDAVYRWEEEHKSTLAPYKPTPESEDAPALAPALRELLDATDPDLMDGLTITGPPIVGARITKAREAALAALDGHDDE